MKKFHVLSLVIVVTLLFGGVVVPASAATETKTVTITEAQINQAYRITNPRRRSITNVSVDLQPGKAVVYATVTWPQHGPYNTVSTFVPEIRHGAIYWKLISATANGRPVPPEVLNIINSSIFPAWRQTVQAILARLIVGPFKVNSVTITADSLIVEYTKYVR